MGPAHPSRNQSPLIWQAALDVHGDRVRGVSEARSPPSSVAYAFGPFRLIPNQQQLLEGHRPVRVGSRALAILVVLVERTGEIVSKEEIFRRVWPDTIVEEGNLRVHVTALRRALGDGRDGARYIASIPGRGYQFVASVQSLERLNPAVEPPAIHPPAYNIPLPLSRMIGRDTVVKSLAAQLKRWRFLTLVGAGGIGKTSVALAVAHASVEHFENTACFVDLARIADPALVSSALAAVLGVGMHTGDPAPGLVAHLRDKSILLVLDSCEHVIDTVAALAENIFKGAPGVHILATSREPLLTEGETIVRLSPLRFPGPDSAITAAEALTYPAVQLFVERAAATLDDFELTDADAPTVAEICRKLDGIPLAIEFASARLGALGVRGLAEHLHDRFRLLTRGRRTALPRHQTLRATLDWSYELLNDTQRTLLRRLGIFPGWFSAEAAAALVPSDILPSLEVTSAIADLVAKSLVSTDVESSTALYRLPDTTRAYAVEKLADAGEIDAVLGLYAIYWRAFFERAEAEYDGRAAANWLARYLPQLDNVRVALDWALSPRGDPTVGIALTVATLPLWSQLSLLSECRERVERAFGALDADDPAHSCVAMKLYAARASSQMYGAGPAGDGGEAWVQAYKLAETVGDTDYCLRALWGLWAGKMNSGEFTAATELTYRFCRLAPSSEDPVDRAFGDRMLGTSLHFMGELSGSRHHIERMLEQYAPTSRRQHIVRYQFDPCATAKMTLARVLWLQGLADQAMRTIDSSIEDALSLNHTLSLCNILAQSACPVALMAGELERAASFASTLLRQTEEQQALGIWHVYANGYRGQILIKQGDFVGGIALVRTALDKLGNARFVQHRSAFAMALAEGLLAAGEPHDAIAVIDDALARSGRGGELWCQPEMLRIKGEGVLMLGRAGSAATAENHLVASLAVARRQGALAWELRTAISLTRLWQRHRRAGEAGDLLFSVLRKFTEGFGTADARAARSLVDVLN